MKSFIFLMAFALFFIFSSIHAFAANWRGPRPTIQGRLGDVVNCDKGTAKGTQGWAYCWHWNDQNDNWQQLNTYCPTVGCDYLVPPATDED